MNRRARGPFSPLGVGAPNPPNMRIEKRDPTYNDFMSDEIADFWYNSILKKLFQLTSKDPSNVDKWVLIATGGLTGGVVSFACDVGTGVAFNNTINLLGGNSITTRSANDWEVYFDLADDVIIPNSLKVSTLTGGLVQTDAQGNFSNVTGGSTPMTFFMVDALGASAYVAPTSDDGSVSFAWSTLIPGALSITATGGGGGGALDKLKDDASDTALPASNAIQLIGDTNITTAVVTHLGPQLQIKLNKSITLPDTTSDGLSGVIILGAYRFIHNKGSHNCFFGAESGNLALTSAVNNVGVGENSLLHLDTSDKNCAFGVQALAALIDGLGGNVAIGYQAGLNLKHGSDCILIGNQVGASLSDSESKNILIGEFPGISGQDNLTAIGFQDTEYCLLSGIYGKTLFTPTNDVSATLVDSDGQLISSKGDVGQVLTSTASGVEWATPTNTSNHYAFRAFQVNNSAPFYNTNSYTLGTSATFDTDYNEGNKFYVGGGAGDPATYTAAETGLYKFDVVLYMSLTGNQTYPLECFGFMLHTPTKDYFQAFTETYINTTHNSIFTFPFTVPLTANDVVTWEVVFNWPYSNPSYTEMVVLGAATNQLTGKGTATTITGFKL